MFSHGKILEFQSHNGIEKIEYCKMVRPQWHIEKMAIDEFWLPSMWWPNFSVTKPVVTKKFWLS